MNSRMLSLTSLSIVGSLTIGCPSSDDHETGAALSPLHAKLVECGTATEGFLNFDLTEADQCYVDCYLKASCEDVHAEICAGVRPYTPELALGSEAIQACAERCEVVLCDGQEISDDVRCDGANDCNDGSDEVACFRFECSDGTSVSSSYAIECDGFDDCADGADEQNCGEAGNFRCKDGELLFAEDECNLEVDCQDGSDEHEGCARPLCE